MYAVANSSRGPHVVFISSSLAIVFRRLFASMLAYGAKYLSVSYMGNMENEGFVQYLGYSFSVGIENAEDIIADIEQALKA